MPIILLLGLLVAQADEVSEALVDALVLDFRQDGIVADESDLTRRYGELCQGGASLACQTEPWRTSNGGSLEAASKVLSEACYGEPRDPTACLVVGWSLSQKKRGTMDPRAEKGGEAKALFQLACDAEIPRGCVELGMAMQKGLGPDAPDPKGAFAVYRDACEAGESSACVRQGKLLQSGRGVGTNYEKAVSLYETTCDDGYLVGCNNLGLMYDLGVGVQKSGEKALEYYEMACSAGQTAACDNLSRAYRSD
ncbi:MAG: sel1 repeat family protein, partial [Proteobacteria bacterium]|nr:sel1 repeat family protein [Pseudomonadota bacterium]